MIQWFTIACLIIALATFPFTVSFLYRARQANRITGKLQAGLSLTPREQKRLNKIDRSLL